MSSFAIDIQFDEDVPGSLAGDSSIVEPLQTAVLTTLHHTQTTPPARLTLLLTGDERMRQLNRDFRRLDEPTDVLSFPAGDPLPGMAEITPYLGDIVISVPYATRQAAAAGHSLTAELQLLAIHGVLHLLGHDHAQAEEKEAMWAAQTDILRLVQDQLPVLSGD